MQHTPQTQTVYTCPSKIVTVIRTNRGLRRFPRHKYFCSLLLLQPKEGTRVCVAEDGRIEYMPSYDELRALLVAMKPELANALPAHLRNKPVERKKRFDAFNARRHNTLPAHLRNKPSKRKKRFDALNARRHKRK